MKRRRLIVTDRRELVPFPVEPTRLIPAAREQAEVDFAGMTVDEIIDRMSEAIGRVNRIALGDPLIALRNEPLPFAPVRLTDPDPFRIVPHTRIGWGNGRRAGKTAMLHAWLRRRAATEFLLARLRSIMDPGRATLLDHLDTTIPR